MPAGTGCGGRSEGSGLAEPCNVVVAGAGLAGTIRLEGSDSELEEAFARQAGDGGYDVVLDYLWGRPTEALVAALTGHDLMAEPTRTRLVQIGEMAGPILRLPAEAVRSSGLEVMGSGGGSIPPAAIFETFPRLWELAAKGELRVDVEPVPLPDVQAAWQRSDLGRPQAGARPLSLVLLLRTPRPPRRPPAKHGPGGIPASTRTGRPPGRSGRGPVGCHVSRAGP